MSSNYDALGQLTQMTDGDGGKYTYTYDDAGNVTKLTYPNGWVEDYTYDAEGNLLKTVDTDPFHNNKKSTKYQYTYDAEGNLITEYQRDSDGEAGLVANTTYTYDALHRITGAKENYGNATRAYTYDSLGNLTYESNSNNVHYDYKLNNLNQTTQKTYGSNDKEATFYTYDDRGNLVLEEYGKLNGNGNGNGNGQRTTVGQYTYDETNKMVQGVNSNGESSAYLYNGLGALVENTWVIAKNGYGYHDVDAGIGNPNSSNGRGGGGNNGKGNGNGQGNGNGKGDKPTGSDVKNTSTVVKQFVVDYTTATFEPLTEHEVNGLDYRYVYGNDRLSVNITGVETSSGNLIENGNQIRLYYHMDYLGTTDYLTSPVSQKVTSWTHYNEWGEITHNAVLKTGQRELDLVKRYATHDYDAVLGMYYAKARMYDAENRRFAAMDPVKGWITEPMSMVQYLYVVDDPLRYIDPLGEDAYDVTRTLARWVIANPAAVWLTQNPGDKGEQVFYAAGFQRDSNGIYHARQDALQQYGGYNRLYDIIFDYATSMQAQSFEFTYNGQDYRFWAWKGDYLNLGAGAELGIYTRLNIGNQATPHWLVDTTLSLPMTMKLQDTNGNLIASYSPSEPQWWITSFNPYYQDVLACNLSVTYTVNFSSNTGMYEAFINSSTFKYDNRWSVSDQDNYTVTLQF